jgi:hypothetical protein
MGRVRWTYAFGPAEFAELSRTLNRRKPLGLSEILNGVDVEERIDRISRPGDRRDAITPGPTLNLTEPLHQKGLAQRVAQRDLPQSDHRMRSSLRGGDGKLRALSGHGLVQPRDQVPRQKGAVPRSAENPLCVRPVGCGPVEPGEDSGERSRMLLHPIGNDGQAERRKAHGIAVGAEKQAFALRREPRNDAGQNPLAANFAQRLIAAAHSLRQTAREHHPRYAESFNHRDRLLACGEPARKALTQHAAGWPEIGYFIETNERRRR